MKKRWISRRKNIGAIGIGTMIVFIAMVLVAGIAASVLIQTSSKLQRQAMTTGQQTTGEVATGVEVYNVEGHVDGSTIDKLAIIVRARAGSNPIDLSTTVLQLSNSTIKCVLSYDSSQFATSPSSSGLFSTDVFNLTASEFGIIVLEDADGSCQNTSPVINHGDKIALTVNVSAAFGGLPVRTYVWGQVMPEEGAPGIISFTTPASYVYDVYQLQ
ncbi:MAG: flagellin [Thermoplasmata archaeon]|nr:MAG: flagellin [Thermoplasmata archaeon]